MMMSHSPRQRVILLFGLSALVLLLGLAVAATFANSETWRAQLARLTGVYTAPNPGITFDRNRKVTGLVEGGRAEMEGVKPGDVIYAVNREPAGDADRLLQILKREDMAGIIRLGVVRENNKLDVIIEPLPPDGSTEGTP